MSKYIIEDPELLKQWDYEKNEEIGLAPDFIKLGSNKEVFWKCEFGHSYQLSPYKRVHDKQGCYYCSNRRLMVGFNDLKTKSPEDAADWDYNDNPDKPEDYTIASMHVANWKCKVCGHKWSSKIRDKVRARLSGCKECSKRKRGELKHKQALEKSGGITDPLLLKEWDYEKNNKGPDQYTPSSNEKVYWKCSKCGYPYDARIGNRTHLGRGCPACANQIVWPGHNDLATTHPQIAKEWHPTKNGDLKPEQFTYGSGKKVWWLCPEGHTYPATILHRCVGDGTNCPACNSGRQTSFAEQAVYYYVKKVFPDAISRYKEIFENSMELDIYIPSIKLAIEYDGEAWHKADKGERENRKWEICKSNGIKLIRLKEHMNEDASNYADLALGIEGNLYEHDKLEQAIRMLLDNIDPESNPWTRRHPQFHSNVDINIKRDEKEIRKYMTKLKGESFASLYSDVAKEWHPTLNGDLTPDKVKPHSDIKVMWVCPECGKEYSASVGSRSYGTGCPKCGIKKNTRARSKKVQMLDIATGEVLKVFDSVSEASREMKISHGNISSVCRGERKQAGGYIWRYKG